MKNPSFVAIAMAACFVGMPVRAATDTPQDRYDIDKTCAAATSAALTRMPAEPDDARQRSQALVAYYHDRAQASGQGAGLTPSRVDQEIDAFSRDIVAKMRSSDDAGSRAERNENDAIAQKCAALPFFEMVDRGKR